MSNCCCTTAGQTHETDCTICGAALVYSAQTVTRTCAVCGRDYPAAAVCQNGHFVCDGCHTAKADSFVPLLLNSTQTDAAALFEQVVALPAVHMHGPEHHAIVPCVLLTAYRNSGGAIDLQAALAEAVTRGIQVPGGICGYWGVCGAAAGAGIFASILLESNPLNSAVWSKPQQLVSACLAKLAQVGGCRCCKRTSKLCIELAAEFSGTVLGVSMSAQPSPCRHQQQNQQCIGADCPYYPQHTAALEITTGTMALDIIAAHPQTWPMFQALGLCCTEAAQGTVAELCIAHGVEPTSFTDVLKDMASK